MSHPSPALSPQGSARETKSRGTSSSAETRSVCAGAMLWSWKLAFTFPRMLTPDLSWRSGAVFVRFCLYCSLYVKRSIKSKGQLVSLKKEDLHFKVWICPGSCSLWPLRKPFWHFWPQLNVLFIKGSSWLFLYPKEIKDEVGECWHFSLGQTQEMCVYCASTT